MAEQYGPIYKIYLGSKKAVVVSGEKELKELMHNPNFDRRDGKESFIKEFLDQGENGGKKYEISPSSFAMCEQCCMKIPINNQMVCGWPKLAICRLHRIFKEVAHMIPTIDYKFHGGRGKGVKIPKP